MKFVRNNLANFITLIRIFGALALIALKPFSLAFFIVYGVCGLSDAFDGLIARKFGISSTFGSALDSLSDLLFYGIMAAKIFPTLEEVLTPIQWAIICVPTALQLIGYIVCAIKYTRFSSVHTYANKILGLFVYAYPFCFIGMIPLIWTIYMYVGGAVALFAGIEIILIHLISKKYDERNKSIFLIKRNEKEGEN